MNLMGLGERKTVDQDLGKTLEARERTNLIPTPGSLGLKYTSH
jgi:hypothetical protein